MGLHPHKIANGVYQRLVHVLVNLIIRLQNRSDPLFTPQTNKMYLTT